MRTTLGQLPPKVTTRHTAYGMEVEFIDPMTARRLDTSLLPQDAVVELKPGQKVAIGLKRWLVDTPIAIKEGLKGDNQYTMSDFGLLTKIPYYLGGAFLTLSYLAGKNPATTLQQGLGVLGYYLTFSGAQAAVNAFYKARYGIDFGLTYKTPDNRYEKVFGSVSYPRIDLLRPQDFWQMRKKMGIPEDVVSPNEAVKHQLPNLLSAAWLDRMVLGNLLAAVVTGYVTRVASVKGLPGAIKSLGLALKNPRTALGLASLATARVLLPRVVNPGARRLAVLIGLGTPLATLAHALHALTPERYEADGLPDAKASRIKKHSPGFAAFAGPHNGIKPVATAQSGQLL